MRKFLVTCPPFLILLPFFLLPLNCLPVPSSSSHHQETTKVIKPHYTKEETNLVQALRPQFDTIQDILQVMQYLEEEDINKRKKRDTQTNNIEKGNSFWSFNFGLKSKLLSSIEKSQQREFISPPRFWTLFLGQWSQLLQIRL